MKASFLSSPLKSLAAAIKFNSIKFKFSVLYTVILGIILVVFSVVLYAILAFYLYQNIDFSLKLKAREVMAAIENYASLGDKPQVLDAAVKKTLLYPVENFPVGMFEQGKLKRLETKWEERADAMRLSDTVIAFISLQPTRAIKSRNFPAKMVPQFVTLAQLSMGSKQPMFYNQRFSGNAYRVIAVPYAREGQRVSVLTIGTSLKPIERVLGSFLQATGLGIPLVLILTSFVGLFFVKRLLGPIEEIARTANRITHEDLDARIKTEHLDSEIEYLVGSFNDMIGRLERSFTHINEFSSQVAHELKTPLAIIKGESELALGQPRDVDEYRSTIRINMEEASRMRKTIEDLLLLARLDYHPEGFNFQSFDFVEFFREICEQTEILAADKGHQIKAVLPDSKILITADKLHLRRMFFNIIDNALKYTLPPGEIKLQVACKRKKILVLISDNGVGIPAQDISKIFDKFYHSDRTGQNEFRSNGLGLSIVHSILKIHHGQVRVTSRINQGTTFHIMLPAQL